MKKLFVFFALVCFFVVNTANAQNRKISGVVTSADDGASIPGVTVVVQGNSSLGTITDIDGKFQLTVPANAQTLVFTSVGMDKQEVAIGSSNLINIAMVAVATNLDEIVVVGYGTQIKSKVTGNIAKVSGG